MLTAGLFGAGTGTVFANQHQYASASAGTKITNVQTANNFALQQTNTRSLTGKVLDESGTPIIGATISVEGSKMKAVTDIDGNFKLNIPEKTQNITVSYVGATTQTINVAGRSNVTVNMKDDTNMLDQVVVVGYNLVKRSQITGAIQEVSGKKIENQTSASLEDRMQGRVAGLLISSGSAQPGSNDVKIRIRGTGSINGSNTPLYILDGNEIEAAQFASLNANDIADIQVLKDASSTAIYGSRGANGVIVITTKQGAAGKVQVG